MNASEIATLYRRDYSKLIASLIRHVGDFELAEDMLQEAFAAALKAWPAQGAPRHPHAWLVRVARNGAIDHLRRNRRFEEKLSALEMFERNLREQADESDEQSFFVDDLLRLFFTCCHPALSAEAQVALTLKTVGGLSTEEVASAFLVPTTTMAQRLVRAKRKITKAGIPYRVPELDLLPERLRAVLTVLYLIFNEGFTPTSGERATREELCQEAIRITRILVAIMDTAGMHDAAQQAVRHRARRGSDRFRQIDDARGDDRPHQRDQAGAHSDHRGPGRVSAPPQVRDGEPARGRYRRGELRAGTS